jgi:hypothetical protein
MAAAPLDPDDVTVRLLGQLHIHRDPSLLQKALQTVIDLQ